MSSDDSVEDAGSLPDDTEEVPRQAGEVVLAAAPHSALVGLMAEPLSRSVPVRRSTVLMLIAFLGFGTLMLLYPPATKTVTTITTTNPNGFIPGVLGTTTTTTHPAATTTTTAARPPVTTTSATAGSTTTTRSAPTTTSTTRSTGSTTTTTGSTTTTTRAAPATTTTTAAP